MGGAGRMGAWPHRRRPHPMAPNVGALCRGASWPTDPGARRGSPGRHGGGGASWPTDLGPGPEGGSPVLPGAGPGPRTCSTRFRSGVYSANRGAAGPGLPASGHLARAHTPRPVLARPNAPWGGWRAALSPGPGPARGHLEQASCGTYVPVPGPGSAQGHHHDFCAPRCLATWSGTCLGVRTGGYARPRRWRADGSVAI